MRRTLKGRDMLIMTGTGMLADAGEGTLGLPFEIFKWTMVAKTCRLKVLFVSVGVEPIRHRLTRWLIKLSLYAAEYICFRDGQSQEYMTNMGFHKRSMVFPDLAFSLPEAVSPASPKGIPAKPLIGVGLYDYCGRGLGLEDGRHAYHRYLEKIGEFVEWLVDRKYPVRVLIGDITYDTGVREDLRRTLERKGINYTERRIVDEPIASISDLFRQIGSTDIVVASRFHNVIISLILAKPVISISYNRKNDSLMAETGLPEYCLRIADFEVAGLIEKFTAIEKHIQEIPIRIRESARENRRALDEQYRLIFTAFLRKTAAASRADEHE